MVGKVLEEKCYPSPIPKGGLQILLIAQFKIADEKRKFLERLKEIIANNYTADFPEGIENQEEYMKAVAEDEQAEDDSDSDHVIDDETDDVTCID